ncbi:IS5 family transposase [Streptomyces sp. CA-142005]|uniref:IS5 family transposase n=1 Tax=Streptomyces sp. CA-142005 TaxID=3240052 RepID=UPI003D8AA803
MGHRGDLTDAQWERLAPLLPVSNGRCGRWRDLRQVMNGVLYRIRTGVQLRDLPERYGPWRTVHERHRPWVGGRNVGAAAPAGAGRGGRGRGHRLGRVRALRLRARSPARGRCPALTAPARQRGLLPGSQDRSDPGGTGRPAGGGGAGGEALGRSRGGFTTKVHLSADGHCRVLSLVLTPGQRADCTQFEAVMERIRVPRLATGRPRTTPDSVSADKGYSNHGTRAYLRGRGIRHVIPEKADQAAGRLRRGSTGGRPPGPDKERYAKRNTVERSTHDRQGSPY